MFDFRLQVFHAVAKRLNFTKAADELFITQPAVTKHIHEIEHYFKIKLFDRNGTKIKLTPAGETLLQHTEQLFAIYRTLEFEMNTLSQSHTGKLRLGASTTVAQYVLPPVLAAFHKKFPEITITLLTNNTEQIELALQEKVIDIGIIEGQKKKSYIKYTEFVKDEIVLVSHINNPLAKKLTIQPEELKKIPLLLREPGSGTLEVIAHALKPLGIKISQLKSEMQLGSTESMKLYLMHSNCMAFLSIHSVLKELQNKDCCIIDIKGLSIERFFYFIQQQGPAEKLAELFVKFANFHSVR
ncbi:MAG: LysR family transcriptional regulator [Sphingobacteriales bacterium]|uniref:LysR family transcriptional regulator n=1 Tax=Hydrotalea flava TaxID=714549 RepID=UPI00082B3B6E|nr:LysR family transcriptional regulator [Hydrotalea flava]RTL49304.1 MAG: LysR family transcriptional regulator [Sphingobacteriales bacterium]